MYLNYRLFSRKHHGKHWSVRASSGLSAQAFVILFVQCLLAGVSLIFFETILRLSGRVVSVLSPLLSVCRELPLVMSHGDPPGLNWQSSHA